MKHKTLKLAALVAAAALTLSACGNDDSDSSGDAGSNHNKQDVAFATDMIPHHAQAVQMAEMAADRADSPEVKALAADIEAAQGPEIERMTGWLQAWGEEVPDTGNTSGNGMDHDMGSMGGNDDSDNDMPGMMSTSDMDGLEAASGAEFDTMFLKMMIEHHQGAIEMAQTEQNDGENSDAIDLARTIESAQTTEIATMQALLGS